MRDKHDETCAPRLSRRTRHSSCAFDSSASSSSSSSRAARRRFKTPRDSSSCVFLPGCCWSSASSTNLDRDSELMRGRSGSGCRGSEHADTDCSPLVRADSSCETPSRSSCAKPDTAAPAGPAAATGAGMGRLSSACCRCRAKTMREMTSSFFRAHSAATDTPVLLLPALSRPVTVLGALISRSGWREGAILVFEGCTFPPVSLGPAGDCPCRD